MAKSISICANCGMILPSPTAFHPYLACVVFDKTHSSEKVEANLKFIVEYGMKAQAEGLDLETAMQDVTRAIKNGENV